MNEQEHLEAVFNAINVNMKAGRKVFAVPGASGNYYVCDEYGVFDGPYTKEDARHVAQMERDADERTGS